MYHGRNIDSDDELEGEEGEVYVRHPRGNDQTDFLASSSFMSESPPPPPPLARADSFVKSDKRNPDGREEYPGRNEGISHYRPEITYISQVAVILTVVIVCAVGLSRDHGGPLQQVYVALLSSCIGVILPSPTIKVVKTSVVNNSALPHPPTSSNER